MSWVALVFAAGAGIAAFLLYRRSVELDARVRELDDGARTTAKRQRHLVRASKQLRDGVQDAKDRSTVLRGEFVVEKDRLTTTRVLLDEVREHQAASRRIGETRVNSMVLRESRRTSRMTQLEGVVLLMTIHRSASTTLFDLLRSHPNGFVEPTYAIWDALGLVGRRYPTGLSNTHDSELAIEVGKHIGALIPPTLFDRPAASVAIEKAHPQFYDFDAAAFCARVEAAQKSLGVPITLVYGIRDPLEAMWSMSEYQRREPSWYGFLGESGVPGFIERSLRSLAELAAIVPGEVIDYEDVIACSSAIESVSALIGPEDSSWLSTAVAAHSKDNRIASQSAGFVGTASRDRSTDGPGGAWIALAASIDSARSSYDDLLARRRPGA